MTHSIHLASPQRNCRATGVIWGAVLVCVTSMGCAPEVYKRSAEEVAALKKVNSLGGGIREQANGYVEINFSIAGVDDEGLSAVAPLTRLRLLLLVGTDVTDEGMEHLAGASSLRQISLKATRVGDLGLYHLRDLTGLEELDLSHTKITDEGLVYLYGLKNLKKVYLDGTAITMSGLEKLEEVRPRLKIFGP